MLTKIRQLQPRLHTRVGLERLPVLEQFAGLSSGPCDRGRRRGRRVPQDSSDDLIDKIEVVDALRRLVQNRAQRAARELRWGDFSDAVRRQDALDKSGVVDGDGSSQPGDCRVVRLCYR